MTKSVRRLWVCVVWRTGALSVTVVVVSLSAQQSPPAVTLSDESFVFQTVDYPQMRAVVLARGVSHPWGLAFLPNGDILVAERSRQLQVIHHGVLEPKPVD